MSYKWIKTDNPQGRERLKQLVDSGETIFAKVTGNHGIFYNVLAKIPNPLGRPREYTFLRQSLCYKRPFDWFVEIGIEFLDPEPPRPQLDENELLPCPFCGGEAFLSYEDRSEKTCVTCGGCGTMSALFTDEDNAIETWNRREGGGK